MKASLSLHVLPFPPKNLAPNMMNNLFENVPNSLIFVTTEMLVRLLLVAP
jgi:hypothetical protein